jgi:deoxyadenosine/deoxycytidine kinase
MKKVAINHQQVVDAATQKLIAYEQMRKKCIESLDEIWNGRKRPTPSHKRHIKKLTLLKGNTENCIEKLSDRIRRHEKLVKDPLAGK